MSELYVCARMQDGHVVHVALQTTIRTGTSIVHMAWTDAEIQRELARYFPLWAHDGRVMLGWRRITLEEHGLFSARAVGERRWYRNALTDANGVLQHDMTKARELHRERLRHYRSGRFADLDGQWIRAKGEGVDLAEVARIEAEQQSLRELPQEAAIDAARTVDDLKAHWRSVKK